MRLESRKGKFWHLTILIVLLSGINFLIMPAYRIQGDSAVIEYVSVRLVEFGDLSVPTEIAASYGEKGQFFYQNILDNKWYSKYGLGSTFIMAIPLYIEKVFIGDLQQHSEYRILFLNLFNILLTLLLFYYSYQLSTLYTKKSWICTLFSLSIFYCTFLFYYIRAQSIELYQTLFFTGFFYYSIIFMRDQGAMKWKLMKVQLNFSLLLSIVFLGLCCLVKEVYIIIIPGFLFIVMLHLIKRHYSEKIRGVSDSIWDISITIVCITILILFIGAVNYYKFGSLFETGYGQWENEFKFSIDNIPLHFISGMIHPQNSLIINFPHLVLSALGIRTFYEKYSREAQLLFFTVLPIFILVFAFGNWAGEFTYGPRYFLFALPVLSIPAIQFFEKLFQIRYKFVNYVLLVFIGAVFSISVFLHFNANSLNYFITYDIKYNILGNVENDDVKEYFTKVHIGFIVNDLIKFRDQGKKLHFLSSLNDIIETREIKRLEKRILEKLDPNFYWFCGTAKKIKTN